MEEIPIPGKAKFNDPEKQFYRLMTSVLQITSNFTNSDPPIIRVLVPGDDIALNSFLNVYKELHIMNREKI